jgi:L-cysteine desulfidase
MTAAAGEARMMGLIVPIIAIAGSGNHGITNFLGVSAVAEELGATELKTARALAISSTITIYIKGYVKRMTAFCGCAVAAATGVAAATVYLLDGCYGQMVQTMQSVIGTLGGMFCDGAKESCAYKLSTATAMAIQFAYLAMKGCGIPNGIGIVGNTIEDSFYNLGQLNNPGMVETDRIIAQLIERTLKSKL